MFITRKGARRPRGGKEARLVGMVVHIYCRANKIRNRGDGRQYSASLQINAVLGGGACRCLKQKLERKLTTISSVYLKGVYCPDGSETREESKRGKREIMGRRSCRHRRCISILHGGSSEEGGVSQEPQLRRGVGQDEGKIRD